MISRKIWFFLFLISTNPAQAIETDFFLENYLAGGVQNPRQSDLNLGNRGLNLPSRQVEADLRGDFTLRANNDQFVKVRPRWILPQQWTEYSNPDETKQSGQGRLDLTDAYWDARWTSKFSTTAGLQVYQWGPAELGNFSNPLFHFNFSQRSLFYKEKGRALVRLNHQWSSSFGQVLLVEPISNRTPLWREGQDFHPQALLKSEYQWDSRNSAGFVIGRDEDENFYFGEYGAWGMNDKWSLYFDARHPKGSRPFAPKTDAFLFNNLEQLDSSDRIDTIGVAGIRVEEDLFDLRIEYFHNSLGWSADQWRSARKAATILSPRVLENAKRFAKPGLELLGRDAFYASIRIPDLGRKKDLTAFLRLLESFQDHSRFWQSSFEKSLSDSWTGYFEVTLPTGENDQELSFSSLGQIFLGAKYVWVPKANAP